MGEPHIQHEYNRGQPPKRRIKVNGDKTDQFELGSGVAQGCPLSPLLFLFIAEPLTKLVQEDKIIEGVTIGSHEHRISQFADDTAIYLIILKRLGATTETDRTSRK